MPTAHAAPTDFDFIIGQWRVSHRRLNARLCGCTEWTAFEGTCATQKILEGFGNVEDNVLRFPDGDVRAAAFRSFNPATQTWAIWWLDGRWPHTLDVPVIGRFDGPVGTFLANDTFEGRPIQMRFLWRVNAGQNPTWEQAFSDDGGVTWETNWTMEFARVLVDPRAAAISPEQLADAIARDLPLMMLDVRRQPAFEKHPVMIAGAVRVPPEQVDEWIARNAAAKSRRIVVYCVYGHEVSQQAAATLQASGFDANFLTGGITAWQNGGHATSPHSA